MEFLRKILVKFEQSVPIHMKLLKMPLKDLQAIMPQRKKWLRGNDKPHVNKMLREAIMKRPKLKNKANKIKLLVDITNYKNS